ncbi:MAG: methyltransferase domain-containing protein [Nitrospinae bacterium]|nr:methyltransferase domain-containing protein [Nitrospinota bacterium]
MKLDRIAFYGRTLDEYQRIYDLTDEALKTKRILDVAAGSASFAAEVTARGGKVVAVDPYYAHDAETLTRECRADIDRIVEAFAVSAHKFDFSFYGDLESRVAYAHRALATFAADFDAGKEEGRYVAASLPTLPFADASFDLALVGHFLSTYGPRLGAPFVEAALRECLRVADEVLVYPLLTLAGTPYGPLPAILDRLAADGSGHRFEPTAFAFQRGADSRLHLSKGAL